MNRKKIEKAASDYAESIPQSDERKKYSRKDFTAGARWRINSVWHVADEKPGLEGMLLIEVAVSCLLDDELKIVGYIYDTVDANVYERILRRVNKVKRWAYVSDLIPDGKEERP